MIDDDLIDTKTAGWSDDWNKSLNDGSIASLLTGAWMPYNLLSGAPDGEGKWRVAQMPTRMDLKPIPRTVVLRWRWSRRMTRPRPKLHTSSLNMRATMPKASRLASLAAHSYR